MRITHWTLIQRELPVSIRWCLILWRRFWWHVAYEFDQFLQGLSASPAWYFVTLTGGVGLLMAITLFLAQDPLRRPQTLSLAMPTLPADSLKPHLNRDPDIDSRLAVWTNDRHEPQFRFDHHQDMAMAEFADGPPVRRAPRVVEPSPVGEPELKWDLSWLQEQRVSTIIGIAETGPIRAEMTGLATNRSMAILGQDGWGRVRIPIGDQAATHRPYAEGRSAQTSPMPAIRFGLGNLDEPLQLPGSTEIALSLEIQSLQQAEANHLQKSRLIVQNDSSHELRSVEVRESLSTLETVVGAEPEAAINAGELYRVAGPLSSGRTKEFELDWVAGDEGRRIHQARVTAEAMVASSTLVNIATQMAPEITETPAPVAMPGKPAIYCRSEYPRRVRQNDVVQVDIVVKNSGSTKLNNVKIKAEIPAGLKHKSGSIVEQEVGALDVGEIRRTVLRMVGEGLGKTKSRVWAAVEEENIQAMTQVDVEVLPRSVEDKPRSVLAPKSSVPKAVAPKKTEHELKETTGGRQSEPAAPIVLRQDLQRHLLQAVPIATYQR